MSTFDFLHDGQANLDIFNLNVRGMATGVQGIQGPQGSQGNAGAAGAQGAQGSAGTGTQGAQGQQGSQGNQGVAGSQGAQGSSGSSSLPVLTVQSDYSISSSNVVTGKFPIGIPIPWTSTVRSFGLIDSAPFYTVPAATNAVVLSLSVYNAGSTNTVALLVEVPGGDEYVFVPTTSIAANDTLYVPTNIVLGAGSSLVGSEGGAGTITTALSVIQFPTQSNLSTIMFGSAGDPLVSGNNTIYTNSGSTTQYGINESPGSPLGTPFTISAPGLLIVNDTAVTTTYTTYVTSNVISQVVLAQNESSYVALPVLKPGDSVVLNCSAADAGFVFLTLCGF